MLDARDDQSEQRSRAATLDEVIEELIATHTADEAEVVAARREYEERRGRVFEDEDLWERWSAAFVEWYVVERLAPGGDRPLAARSLVAGSDDDARPPREAAIRAWLTSHRSLFEVVGLDDGRVELLDLFGRGAFSVAEQRAMHGVEVGDIAELRLLGYDGDVVFGRTFIFHPRGVREAILAHARAQAVSGADRRAVIDHVAGLRVKVERYRHMAPAKVYELGVLRVQG